MDDREHRARRARPADAERAAIAHTRIEVSPDASQVTLIVGAEVLRFRLTTEDSQAAELGEATDLLSRIAAAAIRAKLLLHDGEARSAAARNSLATPRFWTREELGLDP